MIEKIKSNVWKIKFRNFGSNVYLIKLKEKNVLIDTGSLSTINELKIAFNELKLNPEKISHVILTHWHPDHTGGLILFLKSKVYGSRKDFGENMADINKLNIPELRVIETPGHTKGSICILYDRILFSGDTLFDKRIHGRTDLHGSSEKEMKSSLKKLEKLNYDILCPGHDY